MGQDADGAALLQKAESGGCALRYILLTHGHYDHYTGVQEILALRPDLPVYIHEKDCCDGPEKLRMQRLPAQNQRYYKEGDELKLGSLTLRVLETPGHSAGSVTLMTEGALFTGDTLFAASCGRTDLQGSDPLAMRASLDRLKALDGDYRVLPGHGRESTLSREREYNPYLRYAR